jgi:hypothetical protein
VLAKLILLESIAASDATSALAIVPSRIVVVVTVSLPPDCVDAKLFNIFIYLTGIR